MGYNLAKSLISAQSDAAINKIVAIYEAVRADEESVKSLCDICDEFKMAVKVAELAIQVREGLDQLNEKTGQRLF